MGPPETSSFASGGGSNRCGHLTGHSCSAWRIEQILCCAQPDHPSPPTTNQSLRRICSPSSDSAPALRAAERPWERRGRTRLGAPCRRGRFSPGEVLSAAAGACRQLFLARERRERCGRGEAEELRCGRSRVRPIRQSGVAAYTETRHLDGRALVSGCHPDAANHPCDTSWAFRSTSISRPLVPMAPGRTFKQHRRPETKTALTLPSGVSTEALEAEWVHIGISKQPTALQQLAGKFVA